MTTREEELLELLAKGPQSADKLEETLDALLVSKQCVSNELSKLYVEKLKVRNFYRVLALQSSHQRSSGDVNTVAWLYLHSGTDQQKQNDFLSRLLDSTDNEMSKLNVQHACLLCENELFMKRYLIYIMRNNVRDVLDFLAKYAASNRVKQQAKSLQEELNWL